MNSEPGKSDMETDEDNITEAKSRHKVANGDLKLNNDEKKSQRSVSSVTNGSTRHDGTNFVPQNTASNVGSSTGPPRAPEEGLADVEIRNNVDYSCGINKCPSKVACPDADVAYNVVCPLNNFGGSIGSTSQGTCCFLRPNINGKSDEAGPSGISRREIVSRRDSSSGNEGDELSDGEDYCIYTYKGQDESPPVERLANEHQEAVGATSGRSSPEMDFLEMDFDPGPSCEQDTGDSDLASINEDIQNIALDGAEADIGVLNDLSAGKVVSRANPSSPVPTTSENLGHKVKNATNDKPSSSAAQYVQCWPSTSCGLRKLGGPSLYRGAGFPSRESHGYHNTSGDLISPGDNRDADSEMWADATAAPVPENSALHWLKVNLSSTLWHRMMAKKLMLHKQTAFSQSGESNLESELCDRLGDFTPVERLMIWSEQEATMKQVTQISTSACGATSAVNALLALDVPFSLEVLVKGVATRLREPGTPLPRYLVSRSIAGATHKDIIRGLSLASNGAVISKFFPFYPEPAISLSHWLHCWISRGAVPIATLNLQNCGKYEIPDAWHHQMIFGVGPAGIYFTNPLECLPEQFVWHQLVSPSVLQIRRADVLAHWNPTTDLTPLMCMDQRWRTLNVLGQVVNIVRESAASKRSPTTSGPSHVRIPASYEAGITLVMRADSPNAEELLQADLLPLI